MLGTSSQLCAKSSTFHRPVYRLRASLARGNRLVVRASTLDKNSIVATADKAQASANLGEIRSLLDKWLSAVQSRDAKAVTALYAPVTFLLPTLWNDVCTTHEQIERYFNFFCGLQPVGRVDECNTRMLAHDTASNAGVYTFNLVRDGEAQEVQARYSFTYKQYDGEWLIIDHHSSQQPNDSLLASTAPSDDPLSLM